MVDRRNRKLGFTLWTVAVLFGLLLALPAGAETLSRGPGVSILGPDTAEVRKPTLLTARVTNAPAGAVLFEWKQMAGPKIVLPGEAAWKRASLNFSPTEAGRYQFAVTVRMGEVQASAQKSVAVKASSLVRPPTPAVSSSAPPLTVSVTPYPHIPSETQNLVLTARAQGGPESTYSFVWEQTSGAPVTPSNGWNGQTLFFPRGALQKGIGYTFKVTANSGTAESIALVTIKVP